MMRTFAVVAVVVTLATAVAAQSTPPSPAVATATVQTAPTTAAAVETSGYTYNPEGRRDPFVSLMRRAAEVQRAPVGARPGGLSGLTIGEVALKGVLRGRDGYLGILLGADQKSYIVRPGDRLMDGTVRAISADAVVIVQQINDPLAPKTQREVRKMLRQSEEAK